MPPNVLHLILGGHVTVDMTLPGPAPVCRALKNGSSAHHRDDELRATSFMQNRDVGHLIHVQLGNLHGPKDLGKLPLRLDRDVNDHEELQLRNVYELLNRLDHGNSICGTKGMSTTCTTCITGTYTTLSKGNWGVFMVRWTMGNGLSTTGKHRVTVLPSIPAMMPSILGLTRRREKTA